ncbi:VOC family protein [Aureitalea sp. L0-47]|uniref:VOC family protein n=1 Tax=Aureitalea sp. L0-47 TaxID=2816962 RepID=UPI002237653A|nr:VOC family protein [Aureitalea sp. L0-47]MCW5519762.1 VOC family protein [Aureitalea sp. L0-47]
MKHKFEINGLDHVAIRVKDLERSAEWYTKLLGLKRYQTPEWGHYPVFLLANRSGIALFPANPNDTAIDPTSRNVKLDHFAFNVSRENFEKARKHYEELDMDYTFSDHHYFHSIYTKDPDGHTVELTTIVVDEQDFYKQ